MRMTPCAFIPNSSACRTLHELFMDKDSADVVFEIKGDAVLPNGSENDTKTTFYAHRLILNKTAPQLAELCSTVVSPSRVEITNISPSIFEVLLLYVYGGKKNYFGGNIEQVKEIIEAADKYAIINLKLDAEVWYVSRTIFTLENALENLLYADSKNCALLKEAAVDFIVTNTLHTKNRSLLADAPRDVAIEILALVARSKGEVEEFWNMRICELRRRANEKGLDVDGSRNMLIAALEDSKAKDS